LRNIGSSILKKNDYKSEMERTIKESIEKFEPRVRLISVKITETADVNDLDVNITFTLRNTETPITIQTLISRVR
jgi:predicted component of type VI protein secretion system